MTMIRRKPRPLNREPEQYRDSRMFYIACDDTHAPRQYFDFFKFSRIKIIVVPTEDGTSSASHVLHRLRENIRNPEEGDEFWMLLDTDHYTQGAHLQSFTTALSEARRSNIEVALSKPCFEFWLLLHHTDADDIYSISNARNTESRLAAELGSYNKTRLLSDNFPLTYVRDACVRAKTRDATVQGGDIPHENTSRVYLIWKSILKKALPSQLPIELQGLIDLLN